MRELRPRPDLDQMRRQARELLRSARAGDGEAAERFSRLHLPHTLAGAQLALAREHGFSSWPRLKAEVERRAGEPTRFVIRRVESPEDLRRLWVTVCTILGDPALERPHWRVFDDFPERRTSMIVIEHEARMIGGAIELRLLAIEPWARGLGLGRRLVHTVEAELLAKGRSIGAHADPDNEGFFLALGYHQRGRSRRHMYKGVPSGALLARRLERWRARVGDLDAGVVVTVDPATGEVPATPW